MIKFKWYRWIRVLFGARSFVKTCEHGKTDTRVLVSGSWTPDTINYFRDNGYTEEWEKYPISEMSHWCVDGEHHQCHAYYLEAKGPSKPCKCPCHEEEINGTGT